MTNITGDVLRAVADWYDRQPGTDVLVSRLRDDATKADVEAQLLDNLAYVYCNAAYEYGYFNGLHEEGQTRVRAGIRAVLDALAEDVDVEIVDDEPRQWDRIKDVPDDVVVSDKEGDRWKIEERQLVFSRRGNDFIRWTESLSDADNYAPFTEIVDGAQ
ncbi:hypothetical protein ACQR3W_21670 [Rhodococcus ruber]|uniref:Uncharacterized protein n=1 Tax=Rhodococcus ruber TaxID=1830 RepID=A0A098BJN2_9NOCA|nr:hypothetical protein [Rhodococcus ruber]MCZ4506419.1 hypothetical protein [Rhodococcus ruber]MCZ4533711.1 hypothetical protein [Rhodococcus ruber]CDZ88959.1 hypothetical protein RHRU231_450126 [Rhodococcus ruber]